MASKNKQMNKKQYRYKTKVLNVPYNHNGFSPIFCDIQEINWEKLVFGRFGSGGEFLNRHTFVDDWRLEHLWRRPELGLLKLLQNNVVTAPDFTIETNFPQPLLAYQVWRSASLARYWTNAGLKVVPVLQWGDPELYRFCTQGILPGSVVAVRGPQKGTEIDWIQGALFMQQYLNPSLVLHFGRKIEGVFPNVIFKPLRAKEIKNHKIKSVL